MKGSSTCFVTGATGFIGSHLVRRLLEHGCHVRCLARSESNIRQLAELGVEARLANVLDPAAMQSAIAGSDFVFHLDGVTKVNGAKEVFRVNQGGTSAVAEACARLPNPPTLLFTSSLAAVGPALDGAPVTEQSVPHPVSTYGKSKLAAEHSIRKFAASVPATIVRPPIVLGERDYDGLMLFRSIARLGVHFVPTFRRHRVSIIHADDLVSAMLDLATRGERLHADEMARGVYHVASESEPSYAELGRMIGRAVGRARVFVVPIASPVLKTIAGMNEFRTWLGGKPQLLNWDKSREATVGPWLSSSEKIQRQLGFQVAQTMQDRLTQTARWYSAQGFFRIPDRRVPERSQAMLQ